ncbi:MAG TPA: DPP IV N-terminal domain-containing protein [Pyrinomonadaceae bacterium]|nr:DPP IV N-terminal domain-containing protein [Pyrinomonadaceae bacterium]
MKRCPQCRRDYYDDTLLYCLDDGSALLEGPASMEEPATAILSQTPALAGGTNSATQATRIFEAGPSDRKQPPEGPTQNESRTVGGKYGRLVIIGAALMLVTGGIGYGIYRFTTKEVKPELSFQKAKFTRLTTTGKASGVAISPDGKYVVHIQDDGGQQSLWTRQVATQSNVQIVAPAVNGYSGLTFSPDGDYVYYTAISRELPQQVLFRVPTLGGEPKRLVDNVSSFSVSFSPDGKQFAFIRPTPGRESVLMIADADGTAERGLVAYKSPPELIAVPAWSPDGKRIAFRLWNVENNDHTILETQVADGSTRPITTQKWVRIGALEWLADGTGLVVIASTGQRGVGQILHVSYPAGEARQLTNDLNNYAIMSLSADSSTLAVVQSEQRSSIWISPIGDTSGAKPVTSGSGKSDTFLSWTPDGKIVFHSNSNGSDDIWIVGADGTGTKQLTANARLNIAPEVSPDGRYVVFLSDRTGVPHLWRMNIDGSDQRQLGFGANGEQGGRFSPDGRWLVYRTALGRWSTWKMPAEGGEPVQITDKQSRSATVSPDGKLIAYFYREENSPWRLAIAPFEGGEPLKTFDIPAIPDPSLRWTPDGRAVAYVDTSKNGVSNIVAQPLDGGAPKQLTDFKEMRIFSFDYSRDGKQLALSRGIISTDVVLISNFRR